MSATKENCSAKKAQEKKHTPRGYFCTFMAGGIAGAISRTATAPLDRVKILAQEGLIHSSAPVPIQGFDGVPVSCSRFVFSPSLYLQRLRGSSKLVSLAQHIYDEGGWRAFWRGNGVNCMKAGPEFALVFYVRTLLADCIAVMREREQQAEAAAAGKTKFMRWQYCTPTAANFICGAAGGAIAQTILYPLELLKTRMAVAKTGEYPGGFRDCILTSYRRGGIKDFYRGLTPNLMGIVPYRGIEVGLFYTLRSEWENYLLRQREHDALEIQQMFPGDDDPSELQSDDTLRANQSARIEKTTGKPELSVSQVGIVATFSSIVAQTITYPLNIARTRLQTQGVNGRPILYKGMLDCFVKVLKSDGMCGLFSGLGANYLKAVPASAIVFVVFSETEKKLNKLVH